LSVIVEREPERSESPREQRFRPELILQEAQRNTADPKEEIVGAPTGSPRGFTGKCRDERRDSKGFL
jgi:hypothetical protein